jgi:hypothetical protein
LTVTAFAFYQPAACLSGNFLLINRSKNVVLLGKMSCAFAKAFCNAPNTKNCQAHAPFTGGGVLNEMRCLLAAEFGLLWPGVLNN